MYYNEMYYCLLSWSNTLFPSFCNQNISPPHLWGRNPEYLIQSGHKVQNLGSHNSPSVVWGSEDLSIKVHFPQNTILGQWLITATNTLNGKIRNITWLGLYFFQSIVYLGGRIISLEERSFLLYSSATSHKITGQYTSLGADQLAKSAPSL